jgi:hypothetical protein
MQTEDNKLLIQALGQNPYRRRKATGMKTASTAEKHLKTMPICS